MKMNISFSVLVSCAAAAIFSLASVSDAAAFSVQIDDSRFGQCHREQTHIWARNYGGGLIPQSARLYCEGRRAKVQWRDQYGRTHSEFLDIGTPMYHRCGDPCR